MGKSQRFLDNRHTPEHLQALFLEGPVVLFRWRNSQGWPVEYVSPNVTGLLGYSVDELQGHETRYAGLIAAADLAQVMGEVERAEREGTPSFTHRAYRVRRKDGSERWLSGRTQALRNEAGRSRIFWAMCSMRPGRCRYRIPRRPRSNAQRR